MINSILDFSLKNRFLVIMGALLLLGAGISRLCICLWMPFPTSPTHKCR